MYETFNFGEALKRIQAGKKVRRLGWNGKNQWVTMTSGRVLDPKKDNIWGAHVKALAEEKGELEIHPYLKLKNEQGVLIMGWTPSTGDLFAEDWTEVA